MNNDELRDKLNELENLEALTYFINGNCDKYKFVLKKETFCFGGIVTGKGEIKVSKQTLEDFIEYQSEILKEEIERLKKEN